MEKQIEKYLVQRVKLLGGWCLKWVSPSQAGVPDRICLFPGGRIAFVELKDAGKKPRPLQLAVMKRIRKLGFDVLVLDNTADIDIFLSEYCN